MATAHSHTLHGSCSCGRNQYAINLPDDDVRAVNVMLDNSAASRRAHSAPLTAYVAVPLTYYQSATFAFYPDETHRDIRRTYDVPVTAPVSYTRTSTTTLTPSTEGPSSATTTIVRPPSSSSPQELITESQQRHFCGYCGTHFSTWSSSPHIPSAADYIRISLESIADEDFPMLYKLGLLYDDSSDDEEAGEGDMDVAMAGTQPTNRQRNVVVGHTGGGGREWFERMLGGSRVADLRRRGRERESFEEVEGSPAKRKRDEEGGEP